MNDGEFLLKVLTEYGGWVAIAIYIILREVIPFFRTQWWPEYIKTEQYEKHNIRAREDRLYTLLESTAEILAGFKATLEDTVSRLSEITMMLYQIGEDISGLYGQVTIRPSKRNKEREKYNED